MKSKNDSSSNFFIETAQKLGLDDTKTAQDKLVARQHLDLFVAELKARIGGNPRDIIRLMNGLS